MNIFTTLQSDGKTLCRRLQHRKQRLFGFTVMSAVLVFIDWDVSYVHV
jgi:hypothetical protein